MNNCGNLLMMQRNKIQEQLWKPSDEPCGKFLMLQRKKMQWTIAETMMQRNKIHEQLWKLSDDATQ